MNEIRVNNFNELVKHIKSWVASRGGAEKVSLRSIYEISGNYKFEKGKMAQTNKGGIGVELESEAETQKFFLETDIDL